MSKLFVDSNGGVLGLWDSDTDPFGGTVPPTGTVTTLDFDSTDNPDLVDMVFQNWNRITYIGGVLKNGPTTVPVVPSHAVDRARAAASAILNDLGPEGKVLRAIVLLMLDQLNLVRTQPATTFAALTPAQARTGIINKITAGLADS